MNKLVVAAALLSASSLAASAGAMSCQVDSISGLNFGSYDVFGGALDSKGKLSFTCTDFTPGDDIRIRLGPGLEGGGGRRRLQNASFVLEYNLYADLAHTVVWGDDTGQSGVSVPLEFGGNDVDIFGHIEANQNAHTGIYTDTVLVTVVF